MAKNTARLPADATLRQYFREYVAAKIKADPPHPLACLVDKSTGRLKKPAVILGGLPVEIRTAMDLERDPRNNVPRGTVANAEPTRGARYDPSSGDFILDKITLAGPAGIPRFPIETGNLKSRSLGFLQNQDSVAMLGSYIGAFSTRPNDWMISSPAGP